MHWQAEHILHRVINQSQNDCMNIQLRGIDCWRKMDDDEFMEPVCMNRESKEDDEALINKYEEKLHSLFEDEGYDIALETYTDHGSEGGEAYCVYLIRETFAKDLQAYWDAQEAKYPNRHMYFLSTLEYITKHPNQFILVWAGPY